MLQKKLIKKIVLIFAQLISVCSHLIKIHIYLKIENTSRASVLKDAIAKNENFNELIYSNMMDIIKYYLISMEKDKYDIILFRNESIIKTDCSYICGDVKLNLRYIHEDFNVVIDEVFSLLYNIIIKA